MRRPHGWVAQRMAGFICAWISGLAAWGLAAQCARAQDAHGYFERANTLGIFAAYSNDSSHILMGSVERRKLLDIGMVYDRRIRAGHIVNWQYSAELLPVALESDPLSRTVVVQTEPTAKTLVFNGGPPISCSSPVEKYSYSDNGVQYSGTDYAFCHGRRWTIGEAMSPVGFQWNFRPEHRVQPFVVGHGGYMYSTSEIPTAFAGSFNFTFDFGGGFEWYETAKRSWRIEYRYHHISNHGTADQNPGIDNGLLQLTYAFGR